MEPDQLAAELATLGYPGFAYLKKQGSQRDPGSILLAALACNNLDARLFEALPWLVVTHWKGLDRDRLVQQATASDVQNRLGFVVSLARSATRRIVPTYAQRDQALEALELALRERLLPREESLHEMNRAERKWLKDHRPKEARDWNLLTDWQPGMLRYVA